MTQRKVLHVIISIFSISALVGVVGYFVLIKKQSVFTNQSVETVEMPPLLKETQPEINNITSKQPIEMVNWNTYRNENYGIVFKYPDSLNILESYPSDINKLNIGELHIDLVSKNQIKNNIDAEQQKISISSTCLVPENVPKKVWETNFQQGLPFENQIEYQMSEFVKTFELGARKLFVFKQGCYECYDGFDPETQTSIPDPNTEYDGFSAYSCEAGLNKNGNKAARCLTIITERQKIGSLELTKLQRFFLDDFIPTLELQQGLIDVRDCDGLGESVG